MNITSKRNRASAALSQLIDTLHRSGCHSPSQAASLLKQANLKPRDLMPWADFEHPAADGYGRNLVAEGKNFELMVMSWAPGDFSAIHDHGQAEWGAVQVFGRAEHVEYKLSADTLSIEERLLTEPGQIVEVDHHLIHQMGNRTETPFLSLHLYGNDLGVDEITGDARIFNLLENRIEKTSGGVFFLLPEEKINSTGPCPRATEETVRFHHDVMSLRVERLLALKPSAELQEVHRRLTQG